jgi:acyl-coenzyme A synthetase/AMP-(fatty) acid ligase
VIEIVRELPKNFLGKVLRRKLRESAAAAPA